MADLSRFGVSKDISSKLGDISIGSSGTYGEGNVQNYLNIMRSMKTAVQKGSLSIPDFQGAMDSLATAASTAVGDITRGGSKAANAVNGIWNAIQQEGFVTATGGKWTAGSPFTNQEYAKLPNSVLPTPTDVQNGVFDPNKVPTQRYQTPGGGVTTSPTGGTPTTPVTGPNGQPLPQVNPSLPPGINTSTDQGKIALQGSQNAASLQDALNKQLQVNQQAVGQLGQSLQNIPGIYRQEGTSEQQQLQTLADQQKSARAQALTDLGGVLAKNQTNLFNQAIPNLAEQANTSGIYRSTGFGDILANKYANLTANTQSALAQQGISDREAYLQAQQQALGTQLGFSGQAANAQASGQQTIGSAGAGALQAYGAGLGDVANAQIGMQNAGLQRQFSLQDYATQYANALNLANQAKTQGPTGKASPGTQAAIQTGLGIGNTASQVYMAANGSGKGAGGGSQAMGAGISPQFGSVGTPRYL